jgi:cell division protein FtsB
MAKQHHRLKVVSNAGRVALTIAVIIYVTWTVGISINRNYKTNQIITQLKSNIEDLKLALAEEKDMIVYYQTDSYRDVEARRRLGAIAPGEKVIILPKSIENGNSSPEDQNGTLTNGPTYANNKSSSNPQKWWKFIFS